MMEGMPPALQPTTGTPEGGRDSDPWVPQPSCSIRLHCSSFTAKHVGTVGRCPKVQNSHKTKVHSVSARGNQTGIGEPEG